MLKNWLLSLWQSTAVLTTTVVVIVCVAGILLAFAALHAVKQLPVFSIQAIEVMGLRGEIDLTHQNEVYFKRAVLPSLKGNYFSVSLDDVQKAFAQVPWVRHVAVHRVWPNRLLVVIEEHQAKALLNDAFLVNDFGEVFFVQLDEHSKQLPELKGDAAQAARMVSRLNELNQWMSDIKISAKVVVLSDRNAWTAKLSNDMTLELGRDELTPGVKQRVTQWVKLWPALTERYETPQRIDLRYPNGFAIQTHNGNS